MKKEKKMKRDLIERRKQRVINRDRNIAKEKNFSKQKELKYQRELRNQTHEKEFELFFLQPFFCL